MNTLLKKTPNKTDKAKSASALLPKQLHIDGVTYEWIKVLGRGGYAVAVSAKRVDVDGDGKDKQPSVVAIKTLHKANLEASKVQMLVFFAKREVSILKALNHPNIIKLYSHWSDESYIYMIMELCPNNVSVQVAADYRLSLYFPLFSFFRTSPISLKARPPFWRARRFDSSSMR